MKKFCLLLLFATLCTLLNAQTLGVVQGNVTWLFPAQQTDNMTYTSGGTVLTVGGVPFDVASISSVAVSDPAAPSPWPTDGADGLTVCVNYSDTEGAAVYASGWLSHVLQVSVSGNDVEITASETLGDEITYHLSGTSAEGSFTMHGTYKCTIALDGVQLASSRSLPTFYIDNGKRINIVANGAENTFADSPNNTMKSCFYVKGHAELDGSGKISLTGRSRHAYSSNEYTQIKKGFGTLEVLASANDGLHIEQYFEQRGGNIVINNVAGDGIDVAVTDDPLDEMNGQVIISGGSIMLNVAADDTKGIKCDADMAFSGGSISATVSGNGCKGISTGGNLVISQPLGGTPTTVKMTATGTTYMPGDPLLESKCRGIKVKGNLTFDGGDIDISATGAKAKAISVDGSYTYLSGTINCAVDAAL